MPGRSNKLSAYLSISDTADYLDVTTRTVHQMIADGRLTAYRLGARVIRLRRDEIDAAMVPFGGGVA
jgi:excisionase family DNA binding protein